MGLEGRLEGRVGWKGGTKAREKKTVKAPDTESWYANIWCFLLALGYIHKL